MDEQKATQATNGVDAEMETFLRQAARVFPYPPTPDVRDGVRRPSDGKNNSPQRRRWAMTLIVMLVVCLVALALPPTRAAVREAVRIGNIELFREQLPAPRATIIQLPDSLLDLAGRTTLAEAEAAVDFPLRLPAYPSDIGPPDYVFLQDVDGKFVIFVWVDPTARDRILFSLYQLGAEAGGSKGGIEGMQNTSVNGREAFWIQGFHWLQISQEGGSPYTVLRRVEDNTLLWFEGNITYRLETTLPREEAVRIAESLQ